MRNYSFAPGEFYHIYSRGVEKRNIFLDTGDYDRFIKMLFFCNSIKAVSMRDLPRGLPFVDCRELRGEPIVEIGAYCLMPNHFHLLVRETTGGGVSKFMLKLLTGYSSYFNTKNQRTGRLFESSFRSKHAAIDEYLKYLFAYIHLNPLKLIYPNWKKEGLNNILKAKSYLESYPYSSFGEYSGRHRDVGQILNLANFPQYFQDSKVFTSSLTEWMEYSPD